MAFQILADVGVSLTDLKRNPMGALREGHGQTVVILNRNKPAFYAVPPARYAAMLELIDNMRLAEIVKSRQGEPAVTVEIHDLIAQAASDADGRL